MSVFHVAGRAFALGLGEGGQEGAGTVGLVLGVAVDLILDRMHRFVRDDHVEAVPAGLRLLDPKADIDVDRAAGVDRVPVSAKMQIDGFGDVGAGTAKTVCRGR